MGAISTNMCGGIFIHVFYAYVEFSLLLCVCVCVLEMVCVTGLARITNTTRSLRGRQTPSKEPTKQSGLVEFVTPNWP